MNAETTNPKGEDATLPDDMYRAFEDVFDKTTDEVSGLRKHARKPFNTGAQIIVEMGSGTEAYTKTVEVVTINISLGGFCCISPEALPIEQAIRVHLLRKTGVVMLSGAVRSCEPIESAGYSRLGIELLSLVD